MFVAELSRLIAAKINHGNIQQAETPEESNPECDMEMLLFNRILLIMIYLQNHLKTVQMKNQ